MEQTNEPKQPESGAALLPPPEEGTDYRAHDREAHRATGRFSRQTMRWYIIALAAVSLLGGFLGYKICSNTIPAKIDQAVKAAVEEVYADATFTAEEISTEIDMQIVLKDIQAIGELATVEYLYTDAGKFSDPKQLFGWNIPLTTKSFVMRWDGSIKAGIRRVEDIRVEADAASKTLIIYLPEAEILSHTVDKESIEVLDESNGLFNPISVSDVSKFQKESETATEQRALDNGILEKAQENAETLIKNILNANPIIQQSSYSVSFYYE